MGAGPGLQIAQIGALENGRPMVRATNTGMTAIIGPRGNLKSDRTGRRSVFAVGGAKEQRALQFHHCDEPWWSSLVVVEGSLCTITD